MSMLKDYKNILIVGATGKVAEAVIRLFRKDDTKKLNLYSGSIDSKVKLISGLYYNKIDYNNFDKFEHEIYEIKPDVNNKPISNDRR